jgi:hypothetical protein
VLKVKFTKSVTEVDNAELVAPPIAVLPSNRETTIGEVAASVAAATPLKVIIYTPGAFKLIVEEPAVCVVAQPLAI